MTFQKKAHWDTVYATKSANEVSWTQKTQEVSMSMIRLLKLPKKAKIIDIGGGDSTLVDELLHIGFTALTVLDISKVAISKAKERLGDNANKVTWIVSDIHGFQPLESYDLWHDRAAFHFLTLEEEQQSYLDKASKYARNLILGTFSDKGPLKCSGLPVRGYSWNAMNHFFRKHFNKVLNKNQVHLTPFGSKQYFVFGVYRNSKSLLEYCNQVDCYHKIK
jgi:SAM-dependent methyltransferase